MNNFDYTSPISEILKTFNSRIAEIMKSVSVTASVQPFVSQMNTQLAGIVQSTISVQPIVSHFNEQMAATLHAAINIQPPISSINDALMASVKNSLASISSAAQDALKYTSVLDVSSSIQSAAQELMKIEIPHMYTDIIASSLQGIFDSQIDSDFIYSYIEDDDDNDDDEVFAISHDLSAAVSDKKNWEQRVAGFVTKYKERHPVLTWILFGIILFVLDYFASYCLDTVLEAKKAADVRLEANTTSACIAHIDAQSEVLAVDEQPYYYLVRFVDPETGEEHEGWVSKRSVAVKAPHIDEGDGEEDENE